MIKLFKYPIKKVIIYPFGGLTIIDKPINSSINKELLIAFSGILSQLIWGVLGYILYQYNFFSYDSYMMMKFYNYIIIFFNIIPMYPLDGSKIINLLLEKRFAYIKAMKITNIISIISLIIFIGINVVMKLGNYPICLFLVFQLIWVIKKEKYLKERFFLERYLYQFPYQSIQNHSKENIYLLKKNTLHFFWINNRYNHEKAVLKKYFS